MRRRQKAFPFVNPSAKEPLSLSSTQKVKGQLSFLGKQEKDQKKKEISVMSLLLSGDGEHERFFLKGEYCLLSTKKLVTST